MLLIQKTLTSGAHDLQHVKSWALKAVLWFPRTDKKITVGIQIHYAAKDGSTPSLQFKYPLQVGPYM